MGTFRHLPGNAGLTVKAASISDLFETAAHGLFRMQYDTSTVGFEREVSVEAQADSMNALLAEWLNELLLLKQEADFIPGDFIVVEVGDPPVKRYGANKLRVRGTARGRMSGDWLLLEQNAPVRVDSDDVEVTLGRRTSEASITLRYRGLGQLTEDA